MNVRESIETIDRLSKLMIGWVLEYDGIHVANKLTFNVRVDLIILIEVNNEKRLVYFVLF